MSQHTTGWTDTPSYRNFQSGINTWMPVWESIGTPFGAAGAYIESMSFYCGGGYYDGSHHNAINSRLYLTYWNGSADHPVIITDWVSFADGCAWHTVGFATMPYCAQYNTMGIGWFSQHDNFRQWKSGVAGDHWTANWASDAMGDFNGVDNHSGNLGAYFLWWDPIRIDSVSQSPVAVGNTFTIQGTSYTCPGGITSVTIKGAGGDVTCAHTENNDGLCTITVPSGATTGPVYITSACGNVTSAQHVHIQASVTAITQTPVGIGTQFTITGSGFLAGINGITIHGVDGNVGAQTWYRDSDTSIRCVLPSGSTVGTVEVTTDGAGSPTSSQSVYPAVTVSSVSQDPVSVGQTFYVYGTGFRDTLSDVIIHGAGGNISVTSRTVVSDTRIDCIVPAGATTGTVEVQMVHAGSATSTQYVQISGGYYKDSNVLHHAKGLYYKDGGVLHAVKGLYYKDSNVLHPVK